MQTKPLISCKSELRVLERQIQQRCVGYPRKEDAASLHLQTGEKRSMWSQATTHLQTSHLPMRVLTATTPKEPRERGWAIRHPRKAPA